MSAADRFPGIARAALEIALDNGGINRFRPQEQQRRELSKFLERQPQEILPPIDAWLTSLSDEDLSTACCGEHSEMEAILASAPPFTDQLLNDYFDEAC
jgi:hypothetical protein